MTDPQTGSYPVIRKLPDDYYPVIGRLITDWAYLESLLRDCVYMLLRVDRKEGRIAVRSPRAPEIVGMIQELMEHCAHTTTVNLKELRKVLVKLLSARDALAHGVWINHPGSDLPTLHVISGSFSAELGEAAVKARIRPMAMKTRPEDIGETINEIAGMIDAITTLHSEIAAQAGPLPDIPGRPKA